MSGSAPPLGQVEKIVADHEQGAARAQGIRRAAQHGLALGGGELQVEHADQIEGARGRRPAGHVALDPLDLDPVRCGQVARDPERHAREVHARDAPAALGQPHRIASRPHARSSAAPGARPAISETRKRLGTGVAWMRSAAA